MRSVQAGKGRDWSAKSCLYCMSTFEGIWAGSDFKEMSTTTIKNIPKKNRYDSDSS